MNAVLHIYSEDDPDLSAEIARAFREKGFKEAPKVRIRGMPDPEGIFLLLTSTGTLTVLYKTIVAVLGKDKDRKVTIEVEGKKAVFEGYSARKVKEFLDRIPRMETLQELPTADDDEGQA